MIRILAIALALAVIVAGVQTWRLDRVTVAALREKQERNIQIAAMRRQTDMEAAAYEQERQGLETRADAADVALRRLQQSLVAYDDSSAGAAGGGDGHTVVGAVLGDCAAEYRRVAGEADRIRAQLVTLQNWARSVSR